MQAKFFQRYVWLVNTISAARYISMEDIDRRWATSSVNYDHETTYPRRTFLRHKEDIAEIFGIDIAYNRTKNAYYIANLQDVQSGDIRQWLMNNFAVNNALTESTSLRRRIQVEKIPEGTHYLPTIIQAMRDNNVLEITHSRFGQPAHTITLEPYCLKVFKQRWYVYGRPSDHPTERRIYALDRISELQPLPQTFTLPKNFSAEEEFATYYGVFTDKKAEHVRIRVSGRGAFFLRSLPLHHSQKEVLQNDDYSEFTFFIAPTFDFIQQLRTYGSQLIVLSPQWLRDEMLRDLHFLLEQYQQ